MKAGILCKDDWECDGWEDDDNNDLQDKRTPSSTPNIPDVIPLTGGDEDDGKDD